MNTYKMEQLAHRYMWWLIAFLLLACMFDGYYPDEPIPKEQVCYTDAECIELNGPEEEHP
jgi:hypothetical protein